MKNIFIASDNIFSPLGSTTEENFSRLKQNDSGVKRHEMKSLSPEPFYASLFEDNNRFIKDSGINYTKFEQLLISSIQDALQKTNINIRSGKSILIISSTKGNISLLETEPYSILLKKRIAIHMSAKMVGEYFHAANTPLVVCNACISGILAIITGMRLLQSGYYENAIIAGADVISKFVLSGFQSFQAVSSGPCKPFDKNRDGINLGESAATIILSSNKEYKGAIKVLAGATSSDANHISGPSRTGMELCQAINNSIMDASLSATDIDFISAHGTATIYNDEMEANAISLASLQNTPVNSLKGYYGHTLGAAGLLESIVTIQSMKENLVLPTKGFQDPGVTMPININKTIQFIPLNHCLKTASGFGGCNAAVIFGKS